MSTLGNFGQVTGRFNFLFSDDFRNCHRCQRCQAYRVTHQLYRNCAFERMPRRYLQMGHITSTQEGTRILRPCRDASVTNFVWDVQDLYHDYMWWYL